MYHEKFALIKQFAIKAVGWEGEEEGAGEAEEQQGIVIVEGGQ